MIPAGLCETCRNRRDVRSDRGRRFVLCRLSREDPRYPRYPRLPVRACAGWRPAREAGGREELPEGPGRTGSPGADGGRP